jgi:hypothetical protein
MTFSGVGPSGITDRKDSQPTQQSPGCASSEGSGAGSGTGKMRESASRPEKSEEVDLADTDRFFVEVSVMEANDEDKGITAIIMPEQGIVGRFRQEGTSPVYWIETIKRKNHGHEAMDFYGDPSFIERIEHVMGDILNSMVKQEIHLHHHCIIPLDHQDWGINLDDQANFVELMGTAIRRVADHTSSYQESQGSTGVLTVEVVCQTAAMCRLFQEYYWWEDQEDEETCESEVRKVSAKEAKGATGESVGGSPSRSSSRCESCGQGRRGLTEMTTPPRICLGRIPQIVSLCDECLIKEVKQKRKGRFARTRIGTYQLC